MGEGEGALTREWQWGGGAAASAWVVVGRVACTGGGGRSARTARRGGRRPLRVGPSVPAARDAGERARRLLPPVASGPGFVADVACGQVPPGGVTGA